MTHHPFLNPHSSKAILDHHTEHLEPTKIWLAGFVGTLLAILGGGAIWYAATSALHLTLAAVLFGTSRALALPTLFVGTVALGAFVTTVLFILNKLTQEPLRLFRTLTLIIFLLACITLFALPLSPAQRMVGLMLLAVETMAVVTPLTRFTVTL